MKQKNTFKIIFASAAILLMLLPPLAALNSILTESLDKARWYRPIQQYVVPWEARLVAAAVTPFGIPTKVTPNTKVAAFYMVKNGAMMPVDLAWNCLGWQSVLLLFVSLIAGLRGKFTFFSRIKCILFGLLGTLLINVFRMSFIAVGIYYVNSLFGMIVHDYFATFITILWLFFFWWFSYSFVLEDRESTVKNEIIKA